MQRYSLCEKSWVEYGTVDGIEDDFNELWALRPETISTVTLYGKQVPTPRRQQSYGLSYYFSREIHHAEPMLPIIQKYIDLANQMESDKTNLFNMALLNWYADGSEYIGYHSDDERQLIPGSSIYCFSFGTAREFYLKNKSSKKVDLKLLLEDQSLVIMGGNCQKTHQHSIPKRSTSKVSMPRVSITLRKFKK